jgi:hypothetical protein
MNPTATLSEKRSDFSISAVVVTGCNGQHPMHDAANRVRRQLEQQVNVIRHYAIGIQKEWQLMSLDFQER